MGKYIFLTNQYLPKPGATGLCVHQLAKALTREGHDVTTVCYADGGMASVYDGVAVRKILTPSFLRDTQNVSDFSRKLQYAGNLFGKLLHIWDYPLRSMTLVRRYIGAVEELLKDSKNATLIASYTPLEAAVAAMKLKHKYGDRIRTVYYSADTLSNEQGDDGILPASYRTACGIRWEKKLFESFDSILIMECHADHYSGSDYEKFKLKMEIANFPLFTRMAPNGIGAPEKTDKVRLVYAGTLYRKLRNPEFLNRVLTEVSSAMELEAFFLGSGDCEELMRAAEKASDNAIRFVGMQPHDTALAYIGSADVLLSIGNAESPMAPSKIYEYMSTGKPIIHTYTYEKDPCLEPLRRYGNALLIREGTPNVEKLVFDFIRNRKNLAYEEVEKLFLTSTPEYTAKIISRQ